MYVVIIGIIYVSCFIEFSVIINNILKLVFSDNMFGFISIMLLLLKIAIVIINFVIFLNFIHLSIY